MSFLSFFSLKKPVVEEAKKYNNAYDFEFLNLEENSKIKLSDYIGQVVMVVNTASQCGFAGQYGELQMLYAKYQEKGFVVIGVPSNDFGAQEEGSNQDIAKFCESNYGVTFPLTTKCEVAGDKAHPFYAWAKEQLGFVTAPKWNFHKYLIDSRGNLIDYFYTTTPPDAPRVIDAIEKLIAEKQG